MFETVADQADGLRRLFSPRESSVIPIGCCTSALACRQYAATLMGRLEQTGYTPVLFDRLDLTHDLGDVQTHAPVDRVLLLDEPVRLARWLKGRQSSMLLLLSHHRDALAPHYATIKAIALGHGVRRFATFFVDAPSAEHGAEANYRLASCARRFLDVEVELLARGAHGSSCDGSLARLQRFEIGIAGFSPSDLLMPAAGAGLSH
jgi:hypothetical protein